MTKKLETILIKEIVKGNHCIDAFHGETIANSISEHWQKGVCVILDFSDIDLILASFINAMYTILSKEHEIDYIKVNLKYKNLNDSELSEIKRSERLLFFHKENDEDLIHTIELLTDGK